MSGDSARKAVALGLKRGFVQIELVKKIALVCRRKRKDAKQGTTIVNHFQAAFKTQIVGKVMHVTRPPTAAMTTQKVLNALVTLSIGMEIKILVLLLTLATVIRAANV